jgi:hypothetical protein
MYIRIKDNEVIYPYSIQQLKVDERNVSFPQNLTNSILESFGVYNVVVSPKPNDYTKNITEGTPIYDNGVYTQNWLQTDASQSEIDNRIENKWIEIRDQRAQLLQESDWTQLGDIPQSVRDSWTTYRQQLRDITNQSNPFSIVWPTKP